MKHCALQIYTCTVDVIEKFPFRFLTVPFFLRSVIALLPFCRRSVYRSVYRSVTMRNLTIIVITSGHCTLITTCRFSLEKWSLRTTQSSVFCGTITVVYGLHRSSDFFTGTREPYRQIRRYLTEHTTSKLVLELPQRFPQCHSSSSTRPVSMVRMRSYTGAIFISSGCGHVSLLRFPFCVPTHRFAHRFAPFKYRFATVY